MKSNCLLGTASVLAFGLAITPALAEIEVVTVTAQKVSQDIQDVPIEMSAFSANDAALRQLRSITDLVATVPGLEMGELGSAANISMRGVGLSTLSGGGENSVAVNIDGVYLSRPPAAVMLQADVARIEVLEGPQTTLYGKNAIGGVINYFTPSPSDTFGADVRAGAGDYKSYELAGDITGPLSDHVRGRLFFSADGHDGYILNTFNGQRVNSLFGLGVNGALDTDLSSNIELELRAHFRNEQFAGPVYTPYKLAADKIVFGLPPSLLDNLDPNRINGNLRYGSNRKLAGGSATLTVHFGDFDLVSISGYNQFSENIVIGGLGIPVFPIPTSRTELFNTYTQEVDLRSTGGKVVWILGAYGLYETRSVRDLVLVPALGLTIAGQGRGHDRDLAAFADVTYPVFEKTRVYGGARVLNESQTYALTQAVNGFSPCSINMPLTNTLTSWAGRVGIQQDVWSDGMAYVQAVRGFKSGGFEDFTCNSLFKPETLNSYEGGLKSTFFDRRLIANLAVFHYDYSNLQVEENNLTGLNFVNAPRAQVDGLGLSLVAQPIDALQLTAGLSLLNARYTKFFAADVDLIANGLETPGASLAGNPLNHAPKYVVDIGAQYTHGWEGFGSITLRSEAKFSGKYSLIEANVPETTNPSYTLVNLFADYTDPSNKYVFRAYLKNATNVHLLGGALDAFGSGLLASYGPPRTVGFELAAAL